MPRRAKREDIRPGAVIMHDNLDWVARRRDWRITAIGGTTISCDTAIGPYQADMSEVDKGYWILIRPAPEVHVMNLPPPVPGFYGDDDKPRRLAEALQDAFDPPGLPTCAACSKPITGRPLELDEGAVMLCPGDACVNAYARKHAPKRYDPDAPMIVVGPNGEEMTQRELCRRTLEGPDRATPSPPADTTRAKGEP